MPDYTIKLTLPQDGEKEWTVEVVSHIDGEESVVFRSERLKLDGMHGALDESGDAILRDRLPYPQDEKP